MVEKASMGIEGRVAKVGCKVAADCISGTNDPAWPHWVCYLIELLEGEARNAGADPEALALDIYAVLRERIKKGGW